MQPRNRKIGITALATTSMLTALSSAAYATPPNICANPLTGASSLACWVGDENFTVANTGSITPAETATGIAVHTDYSAASTLINNGTITMAGLDSVAYKGISFRDLLNGAAINNGTISVTSVANTDATGYGIYVADTMNGSITNTGTIGVTATSQNDDAQAYGIYLAGDANGTITNNGSITATATNGISDARADAIDIEGALNGTVTNDGTLTATAHMTDSGAAEAYGIRVSDGMAANAAIINNGTIAVTGSGNYEPTATGIYVNGNMGGTIVNNGTITATADDPAEYGYGSWGIAVGTLMGSVVNNGTITATTTGGPNTAVANGISAGSVTLNGSITNNGTITASVHNNTSSGGATGIFVGGNLDGTLTNTGTITASFDSDPAKAYSLYVDSGIGTVNNSGLLFGNLFTGGTVDVTNSGIIALPAGADALITHDYAQAAGGTLSIGVQSNTSYGSLAVGGNADFADGTKIAVNLQPGSTYTNAPLGVIFTSGALNSGTFTVTDNSLAYNFTASVVNGTGGSVTLFSQPTGLTTLVDAVNATGHGSEAGAAAELDQLLTGGSPQVVDQLSAVFGGATTNQQAAAALGQFLPGLASNVPQVLMDMGHTTTHIVQSRLDGQSGVSSGETLSLQDRNFWIKPFGTWTNQDDRNGATGYDASTGGAVLGGDALIRDKLRLGAAFAYAHSNVDDNGVSQSDRIDSYQGILYGSYDLGNRTAVNVQGDVSDNTNQGRRSVAGGTAFANYDSWAEHAGVGVERKIALGDNATSFTPSLRADYTSVTSGGYAESGAGAFNLNVDGSSAQELIVGIDGKLDHQLTRNLKLSGDLGVGYDTLGGRTAIASSFAGGGAAFVTPGIKPSPWIGNGGIGLTLNQWRGVELTARYDIEAREDFTQQTASLKLRLPF